MLKNFPRNDGGGWHHCPGEYDDFDRLRDLYPILKKFNREEFNSRVLAEACWWELHNKKILDYQDKKNVFVLRFDELSDFQNIKRLAKFLGVDSVEESSIPKAHSVKPRNINLGSDILFEISKIVSRTNLLLHGEN
jgi:hypothetical protein